MIKIPPKELVQKLREQNNIWVATVRPDERPHLTPVWFVWMNDRLYLWISPDSVKARNMRVNPKVALALEDGNHPVICEGIVVEVLKPWPEDVINLFNLKYDEDIASATVVTMLVEVRPEKWLYW